MFWRGLGVRTCDVSKSIMYSPLHTTFRSVWRVTEVFFILYIIYFWFFTVLVWPVRDFLSWTDTYRPIKGIVHPKNENVVIFHLPPCHTPRYFGWEPGGLWLSHWLRSKLHCQGPEKYEKHHQDTPSAISGSIWLVMKRREYFLYGNKTKITTLFNNLAL